MVIYSSPARWAGSGVIHGFGSHPFALWVCCSSASGRASGGTLISAPGKIGMGPHLWYAEDSSGNQHTALWNYPLPETQNGAGELVDPV